MADLAVEPGDTIVLLTDGLVETMSPDGRPLGSMAVVEALARHRHESSHELSTRLVELAHPHRGGHPQTDDLTLAVFCR